MRVIAGPTQHFINHRAIAGDHADTRPDCAAVGLGADALHQEPVPSITAAIAEQGRQVIEIVDHDVDIAVVVNIAKSTPAADALRHDSRACIGRYVGKFAVRQIPIENAALLVCDVQVPVR